MSPSIVSHPYATGHGHHRFGVAHKATGIMPTSESSRLKQPACRYLLLSSFWATGIPTSALSSRKTTDLANIAD